MVNLDVKNVIYIIITDLYVRPNYAKKIIVWGWMEIAILVLAAKNVILEHAKNVMIIIIPLKMENV